MKKGKFKVPIYEFTVDVIIVENEFKTTEFYSKLIKKLKQPSEGENPCEGFVYLYKLNAWVVLSEKHLCYGNITHEVSHLTFKIMNFNEIEDGRDNENFALLNGFLNGKVFKIIEKLNCKIITK